MRGSARRLTEELRAVKDRSGLSLTQIGTATHYSKASWERWFNGKRLITEHALESLAVSVDESARLLGPLLEQALLEAEQTADPTTPGQRPAVVRAVSTSRISTPHVTTVPETTPPETTARAAVPAPPRPPSPHGCAGHGDGTAAAC
ncbi:helix-turn-helix domain-containing protein [Streptacidiphilus rugosus]|uniref:helix-turn-helix domain-containing protein n=1 Tax=Streptacidiphilus rugosus TaxID=405783 RepID=UPI0018DE5C29|nr:helix-turn-helix transcriptional regulator [Streptacidiphilus rugosus]